MKLIVLKNNEPLTEYSLKEEDIQDVVEIYVGRSKDCHLYLEDPLISRHHFLIEKNSGNWNIKKITKNILIGNGIKLKTLKYKIKINIEKFKYLFTFFKKL